MLFNYVIKMIEYQIYHVERCLLYKVIPMHHAYATYSCFTLCHAMHWIQYTIFIWHVSFLSQE